MASNKNKGSVLLFVVVSLFAVLGLGYLATTQLLQTNPNAANTKNSFFLLTTNLTVDQAPESACNTAITQYTVTAEVFHELSKSTRGKESFTVSYMDSVNASFPTKIRNLDSYYVASRMQKGYYRVYYKIEAKDYMGRVITSKTGVPGPSLTADTQTSFDLNFFCTLGEKPAPTPIVYPNSASYRANIQVTVTKPTDTTKSCNSDVVKYQIFASPYDSAAASPMDPRKSFTVTTKQETTSTLVTFSKYIRANILAQYTNKYMVFTIHALDSAGKVLFSYPSTIVGKNWPKETYKFVTPPSVTEAKLSFDCNLETAK